MAKTESRHPPGPATDEADGARGPASPGNRAGGLARLGARGRALFGGRPLRRGAAGGRRRPPGKALLFAVAGITIVAVLAWALLGSRLLVVRSVQVVGAGRGVSAAQVLAAAHVAQGTPLIRVDTGAIARQVERLNQVQSADVSKDWPSTLVITVRPRVPVFVMRAAGGYALVDRFGVSVRDVAARPPGYPLLSVPYRSAVGAGTSLRGSPAVRAAAAVLSELPRRIARQVRAVSATSAADVSVTLADGAVVVWGNTSRANVKAKELTVLMHRHFRTYDVSGTGTAVTKG
jgi:cell division protein FtsQ